MRHFKFLTASAFLLFASTAAFADDGASLKKMDRVLRSAVLNGSAATQPVIVRAKAGQLSQVRDWLTAKGAAIESETPGLNAIATNLSVANLGELAARLETATLSVNGPINAFGGSGKTTTPTTFASTVLRSTLGLTSTSPTGNGIGVAVIDTGINPSTDLEGRFGMFYDYVNNGGKFSAAYDDNGHGTHVAGLIGASGALGTDYTGVAPQVKITGFKVLDATGAGKTSDVVNAIMYVVANRTVLGIDIINLSLGHPIYEAAATDPLVQAVEAASRAGILVVTAAGNFGVNSATGLPGYGGITSPGNAPSALTVGALDTKGTVGRGDDRVAPYSSAGPTWYDGLAKPDILAPGHHLISDAKSTEALYVNYPTLRIDATHMMLSGTSMAAAVATGAAAVVLQASRVANAYPLHPSLTTNALKAIIEFSAIRMRDAVNNDYDSLRQGAGALNIGGAVALAQAIDTSAPVGSWWLTSGVNTYTTIDGQSLAWSQDIVWGTNIVWGTKVFSNQQEWAQNIVWGTNDSDGDNIVWGTTTADPDEDNIVWGTNDIDGDNIVWGTNIVWGSGLIGTTDGLNIVWGTAGPDASCTAWGSLSAANIVWGTNIVWSSLAES